MHKVNSCKQSACDLSMRLHIKPQAQPLALTEPIIWPHKVINVGVQLQVHGRCCEPITATPNHTCNTDTKALCAHSIR